MNIIISCGDDDSVNTDTTPTINSISPQKVFSKQIFEISGKNFGTEKPKIFFTKTDEAEVISWNDSLLSARFIAKPGDYSLFVQVGEQKSNTKTITIQEKPTEPTVTILSISPNKAYKQDIVKIEGQLFGKTRGSSNVYFGETLVNNSDYVKWSDEIIECKVPLGVEFGECKVSAIVNGKTSNKVNFTVLEKKLNPKITKVSPQGELQADQNIKIIGSDFGTTQEDNSYIMINELKITEITSWTNDLIRFTLPADAVTGKLKVVAKGCASNLVDIKIKTDIIEEKAPIIESLSTNEFTFGNSIKIEGKYFGKSKGKIFLENNVEISTKNILKWKDEVIRFNLPTTSFKAGKLYIVTANNKESNKVKYFVKINDR